MSTPILPHRVQADQLRPKLVQSPPAQLDPAGRRIPFGWGAFAVQPAQRHEPARLSWPDGAAADGPARFRVTVASDDRELKRLRVALAGSGQTLGELDIRYGTVLQPFELALSAPHARAAVQQGVTLTLSAGTTPLWLLYDAEPAGDGHAVLLPHLLVERDADGDPLAAFFDTFTSLASLQQFGWMQGCVLEGLNDLANCPQQPARARRAADALQAHLALFFPGDEMVYEDPRGVASDGRFHGIEATLMAAALARHRPGHPGIDDALRFWQSRRDDADVVADGAMVSCEGSLTVAYPMSVLACLRQEHELARLAVAQLLGRQRRLRVGEDLYLRHNADNDTHTYRNWSRGVAWYLLGLTRSLIELDGWMPDGALDPLKEECQTVGRWAIRQQRDDGLWNCYLHAPETEAETSGSAGIAAGLALADRHGFGPDGARPAAERAFAQLQGYLTPDGLLRGVSQSNKKEGGEALQRGGYRTISQTGMGLLAQLAAALECDATPTP